MATNVAPRPTFSLRQLFAVVTGAAVLFAALSWALRVGAWWWASQSLELSLYFYPGFAWAAAVGSVAALIATAADRRVWRPRSLWMLSPPAVPILLLAFGIVFQHSGATRPPTEWPRIVVEWFPWLLLPLGVTLLCCFRSISNWIIILGISTAALWLTFGSRIMSWMSVTNVWL